MHELFQDSREIHYKAGSLIIMPGYDENEAWLITSGIVRQYTILDSGDELTLNIYKSGSVLALTWLLGGISNRYFYEASGDVNIRKIPGANYKKYLKENPEEALVILERLSAGLDGIFKRIAVNSKNNAKDRVLNELQIHTDGFGVEGKNGKPKISITIKELAQDTGLARETVSRVLSMLEEDKVISRKGKSITIIKD